MIENFIKIKKELFEAAWGSELSKKEYVALKNIWYNNYEGKLDLFLNLLTSREGMLKIIVDIYDAYLQLYDKCSVKSWDATALLDILKRSGPTGLAYSKLWEEDEELTADDKREIIDGIRALSTN